MAINNVCEGCGGELIYDATSGELKCNRCSSIVDIPEQNTKLIKKTLTPDSTIKVSKTKYVQYHCSTCGRNHIVPTGSELFNCPSCSDSNLTKTINVEYMPDGIIPFTLNKEKALSCFKNWLKTRKFAPNNLVKKASNFNMNGIYLPAYLYNFDCFSNYGGVGVWETTTYTHNSNGQSTPIVHYHRENFSGTREDNYRNFLDSANSKIHTETIKKIANYNYQNLYVYRPEFLYGLIGSEADIPLKQSSEKVKKYIQNDISNKAKFQPKYTSVENFYCKTTFNKSEYNFVYLPIFSCNYKFKNNVYNFFINGATGKTHGEAPKSKFKITSLILCILGIIGVITFLLIKYL